MIPKGITSLLLALLCSSLACAAEWQWSAHIQQIVSVETGRHPEAFLWIPPDCSHVNAVVVGQHNMCEETLFENVKFRERMQACGIAVVWITPILDFEWDVTTGCNDALLQALESLAEISGYDEIADAPIVPVGHSAMATFPWNFAAWNPERTLAIISYHGDAPRTNLTGYGGANLEWGRTRNIDGIPGLMVEGEYEWWEARVNPALAFRMMYPESCISFLCDTERGHFDVADRTADYIGMFIQKALKYRLTGTETQSFRLKRLDPEDGWLAERWRTGSDEPQGEVRRARLARQPRRVRPAPFKEYRGDLHDAFWYFDEEMAMLTEEIYSQPHDMLPQYLGFEQNGQPIKYDMASHVTCSLPFKPEDDGITFHLKAIYTDSLHMSATDNHCDKTPVIERICGPVAKVNDTTFRLAFYRMGTDNRKRTGSITLVASSDGDARYKGTVQELNMTVPYPLTAGRRQSILFPSLPDIQVGTECMKLNAVSDCGLNVSYYIKEGPAEISGDTIIFTDIPPRSRFPLKVTVVAWQYGIQGKVQTAAPVERSFYITEAAN